MMPLIKRHLTLCINGIDRALEAFLTDKLCQHVRLVPSARLTIFTTIGRLLPLTNYQYDPTVFYIAAQTDVALQFITKILETLPRSQVTLVDFPPNYIMGYNDKIRTLNALAYSQKSSLVLASSHRDAGTEYFRNAIDGLTNTSFQYWDDHQIGP